MSVKSGAKTVVIGAGCLAAGLALALGINAGTGQGLINAQPLPVDSRPVDTRVVPGDPQRLLLSYSAVVKRAAPAVVNVYSARVDRSRPTLMSDPFFQRFFGGGQQQPPRVEQSLGSGVIVAADGLIVTNNHVVAGADQILVALADRREYPAKLVFADARLDLALLRIEARNLPVVPLGDSDRAEVGDVVLAIGDPFGVGQTVTHGIVSATARTGQGVSDYQYYLQTDAAINPGNSGGALLDMNGRLLGINTAIASSGGGSNGIGFAIPSNMVRVFVGAAKTGKLVTGWIGVEGEALTSGTAAKLGLDRAGGVLITDLTPGSPAAAAGVKAGDVLVGLDGKEVVDLGQLRYRIATQGVGTRVNAELLRGRERRTVALTIAAPPETPARALVRIEAHPLLTGVTVGNLSPAFAQEVGAGLPERGVVVTEILGAAPAARLRYLLPGDLIEAVNGVQVRTTADVAAAARSGAPSVRFNRGGRRTTCAAVQGQLACG